MSDALKERLDYWAAGQRCPACTKEGLRIEWRVESKPPGTFSLAGSQLKFSAKEAPWIVCPRCGEEARGEEA